MTSPIQFKPTDRWVDLLDDDTPPIRQTTSLSIREVPKKEWSAVHQVMNQWFAIAENRFINADATRLTTKYPNMAEITRLDVSKMIILSISLGLSPATLFDSEDEEWDTLWVCEDKNSKIQAVALLQMEKLKLVQLATHPDNIIHAHNDSQATAIRGAGSQIILELARHALNANEAIRLKSTEDAENFYKKLGFTREVPQHSMWLHLTPARIRELVAQKVPPFNQLNEGAPAASQKQQYQAPVLR